MLDSFREEGRETGSEPDAKRANRRHRGLVAERRRPRKRGRISLSPRKAGPRDRLGRSLRRRTVLARDEAEEDAVAAGGRSYA